MNGPLKPLMTPKNPSFMIYTGLGFIHGTNGIWAFEKIELYRLAGPFNGAILYSPAPSKLPTS